MSQLLLFCILIFMYFMILRTKKRFWDKPGLEKFYVIVICFYSFVMVVSFILAKFFSIGTFEFF